MTDIDTLIAEVQRLRAALADAHRREAEALRRADAASASLATARGEVRDLRADLEEQRLTLAAEQGRQEGAPYDCPEMVLAMVNGERIRRGLSWRELATILGVSPSTLTRWTHGKMLSVPAYLRVCKWLDTTISDTIEIARAGGPGWCDRCSPDRCDCEDNGAARAAMQAADAAQEPR